MKKRLSKVLANGGIASRRACEELIFAGRVKVNGETVYLPQTLVDSSQARITVDGKPLMEEEKVYFLLNKPSGYLCTSVLKKQFNAKRVIDLFAHLPYRLFTVGRLDQETEGLLLITNDGLFAQRVIHPSSQVTKEYLVKTGQEITDTHLKTLSAGIWIDGQLIQPLSAKKVRKGTLKIVLREGKKHEIRHLAKAAGLTIHQLTRIRLGPLVLGNLPIGTFRSLSLQEISSF